MKHKGNTTHKSQLKHATKCIFSLNPFKSLVIEQLDIKRPSIMHILMLLINRLCDNGVCSSATRVESDGIHTISSLHSAAHCKLAAAVINQRHNNNPGTEFTDIDLAVVVVRVIIDQQQRLSR